MTGIFFPPIRRVHTDTTANISPPLSHSTKKLLVYSAATNTGMHILQFARIFYPSTYVIAVASETHHERLRALGADACFDYRSPRIEEDVRKLGKNVTKAVDCHSEGPSTALCAKLMGEVGGTEPVGRIVRTLPLGMSSGTVPRGVKASEWILSYTALGKVCFSFFSCYHCLHNSPFPSILRFFRRFFHGSVAIVVDIAFLPSHSGSSSNITLLHLRTTTSRVRA